ncbi:YdeI/OmpD-associated family protein [Fulvivirga ligni]|uniref:YdeI/OmpD-associated family protein n=1 Tax=Fulvivirga ligni TaxID=2904246 RepID=UPI001F2A52D3|nr:YdeI/OmpD-associated family protein [Fulvivirga ligni]UII20264.1 YdeI/OmpD-associated family protein [Fulvivirga ligni]
MTSYNPDIDLYLQEGCGRCPLGGTEDCKVHRWTKELKFLREIVLDCSLTEELKWSIPCYTHKGKNIATAAAFKDYCSLSFFKGSLLSDPDNILDSPGENSQFGRLVKITSVEQIQSLEDVLKAYIYEAIEIEKAGLKVETKKVEDYEMPEEFQARLDQDVDLRKAFEALTPGRKKGYLIYFAQAKQPKTRAARVEKHVGDIIAGKGLHDR